MEQIGTGSWQTDGAQLARSVGAANTKRKEGRRTAEVARLNARRAEREQTFRDHTTEIDEKPSRDLVNLEKVGEALAKEYWKLKTSKGAVQLKTGLSRNWDYFLVCIPLIAIKMIDLITR